MKSDQDVVQNYSVSLALDPKVMQWFATKGNDNFILAMFFSTLNYPPDDPQAIARCKQFVTNPGGSITASKRFPGENTMGHYSGSLTFVAEAQASACFFGSIGPNTSSIAFQLRTTYPGPLQNAFQVYVGADAYGPNRVPTTSPHGYSMLSINGSEMNGYQGTGTLLSCPLPVTGFKGSVNKQ